MNVVSAASSDAQRLATFAAPSASRTRYAGQSRFAPPATRPLFSRLTRTARQFDATAASPVVACLAEAGACIAADYSADAAAREVACRSSRVAGNSSRNLAESEGGMQNADLKAPRIGSSLCPTQKPLGPTQKPLGEPHVTALRFERLDAAARG